MNKPGPTGRLIDLPLLAVVLAGMIIGLAVVAVGARANILFSGLWVVLNPSAIGLLDTGTFALTGLGFARAMTRGRAHGISAPVLAVVGLAGLVAVAVARLGSGAGLITLLVFAMGRAMATRELEPPGRPHLVLGLAGGALCGLGPFGAALVLFALMFWMLLNLRREPAAQILAELVAIGFVPFVVMSGLGFASWLETGAGITALTVSALKLTGTQVSASPWLAAFGGSLPAPVLILSAAALAAAPLGLTVIPGLGREPMGPMTVLIPAMIAAASLLTLTNTLQDPSIVVTTAFATSLAALPAAKTTASRNAASLAGLCACTLGVGLGLGALAAFAPQQRPSSVGLTWSLADPMRETPPGWGVAPRLKSATSAGVPRFVLRNDRLDLLAPDHGPR